MYGFAWSMTKIEVTCVYATIISEDRLVSHLASNSVQVSGSLGG